MVNDGGVIGFRIIIDKMNKKTKWEMERLGKLKNYLFNDECGKGKCWGQKEEKATRT